MWRWSRTYTLYISKMSYILNLFLFRRIYYEASRTLCIPSAYREDLRNITVRISTCSTRKVTFSIKVSVEQDYIIPWVKIIRNVPKINGNFENWTWKLLPICFLCRLNQEVQLELTPTTPIAKGFLFSRNGIDISSVKLLITSTDLVCLTVSIQPLTVIFCSFFNHLHFSSTKFTL